MEDWPPRRLIAACSLEAPLFADGAIWLLGFLLVGLTEEYRARGYIQYTLARGVAGIYQWAFKIPTA